MTLKETGRSNCIWWSGNSRIQIVYYVNDTIVLALLDDGITVKAQIDDDTPETALPDDGFIKLATTQQWYYWVGTIWLRH